MTANVTFKEFVVPRRGATGRYRLVPEDLRARVRHSHDGVGLARGRMPPEDRLRVGAGERTRWPPVDRFRDGGSSAVSASARSQGPTNHRLECPGEDPLVVQGPTASSWLIMPPPGFPLGDDGRTIKGQLHQDASMRTDLRERVGPVGRDGRSSQKVTGRARKSSVPKNISRPTPTPQVASRTCHSSSRGNVRLTRVSSTSQSRDHGLPVGEFQAVVAERHVGVELTFGEQLGAERAAVRQAAQRRERRCSRARPRCAGRMVPEPVQRSSHTSLEDALDVDATGEAELLAVLPEGRFAQREQRGLRCAAAGSASCP